jgi:nicotinamidase-related amidase
MNQPAGNAQAATPRTLLQMRGAVPPIPRLAEATVLLIDWQEECRSGLLALRDVDRAIESGAQVLDRARAAGARVVHVAHAGGPGEMFDRAAARGAFVAELAPLPGERIIEKSAPSAFTATNLGQVLDDGGRRPLVVLGAMTHMCVSSTLRAAAELGYHSCVVADACATRDLPLPGGEVIPAHVVHAANLAALGDRFARVVRADDLR